MSAKKAEVVGGACVPISLPRERARDSRSFDDRLVVRFPGLFRLLSGLVVRLPRRSSLRRAMLRHALRRGYAAGNRRDFDRLLLALDPAIELRITFRGGLYPPDLDSVLYGREGYRRAWEGALEAFEDFRLEPEEFIDLGDRILVTIHQRGHGRGSGAPIDQQVFQLFELRRGLVIRQVDFVDRSEALKAAGLSE